MANCYASDAYEYERMKDRARALGYILIYSDHRGTGFVIEPMGEGKRSGPYESTREVKAFLDAIETNTKG